MLVWAGEIEPFNMTIVAKSRTSADQSVSLFHSPLTPPPPHPPSFWIPYDPLLANSLHMAVTPDFQVFK